MHEEERKQTDRSLSLSVENKVVNHYDTPTNRAHGPRISSRISSLHAGTPGGGRRAERGAGGAPRRSRRFLYLLERLRLLENLGLLWLRAFLLSGLRLSCLGVVVRVRVRVSG